MKVYVATRFRGAENKNEVEALCKAVHEAGLVDFNFARDVERYKHLFHDPQERWERANDEITACNALLIDVSDYPSGGRLVEAGIAYARRMPIIVVKRRGVDYKALFDGIASVVIEYDSYKDLTSQLKAYESERNFTVNDRLTMLISILTVGALITVLLARVFVPLAIVWPFVYWLVIRLVFPSMRVYDRVVIYIPLIAVWAGGIYLLLPLYIPLAIAWAVGFWLVALVVLKKLKFSL